MARPGCPLKDAVPSSGALSPVVWLCRAGLTWAFDSGIVRRYYALQPAFVRKVDGYETGPKQSQHTNIYDGAMIQTHVNSNRAGRIAAPAGDSRDGRVPSKPWSQAGLG